MPLLDMLQEIHFKLLKRVTEKRDEMMTKELQLCPKIKKILDERITQSRKWRAVWDGATRYQVKYNTRFVTVDLEQRSCDCRVFDLSGIPCAHALAAILEETLVHRLPSAIKFQMQESSRPSKIPKHSLQQTLELKMISQLQKKKYWKSLGGAAG